MKKWTKRSAVLATGMSGLLVVGIASAAWTTNASGNATSKADSLGSVCGATVGSTGTSACEVVATSAPTFAGTNLLHPGLSANGSSTGGDLTVTVTNLKNYTLYVDSVVQNGDVTTSNTGTCANDTGTFPAVSASASAVYVSGSAITSYPTTSASYTAVNLGTPVAIPSGASQTIELPNVVSMGSGSNTGCQGVSFTVPVTLTIGTS